LTSTHLSREHRLGRRIVVPVGLPDVAGEAMRSADLFRVLILGRATPAESLCDWE
jgi:hypothetical protein